MRTFYVTRGKGENQGLRLTLALCSLAVHSQTTNGTNVSLLASHHIWPIMNQPPFPINVKAGLFRMWKDVISLPVSFSFSLKQLMLTLKSWLIVNLTLASEIWEKKSATHKYKSCFLLYFSPLHLSVPPSSQNMCIVTPALPPWASTSSVL